MPTGCNYPPMLSLVTLSAMYGSTLGFVEALADRFADRALNSDRDIERELATDLVGNEPPFGFTIVAFFMLRVHRRVLCFPELGS